MKGRPDKGAGIETRGSVFDSKDQRWTGIDHSSPDEILGDKDLRLVTEGRPSAQFTEFVQGLLNDVAANSAIPAHLLTADFSARQEVWKTLVRYVWHNARSVAEACVYFGVAALHLDPHFRTRMQRGELKAIAKRGSVDGRKYLRVFRFKREAVYRSFKPLDGYTPLSALLDGDHGEWRADLFHKEQRRSELLAIIRSAWQDVEPGEKAGGKWENTLRGAFMNFTALTGEDRALLAYISQTEFACAFDETRAATCAREKRRVKRVKKLNGCKHVTAAGGKSETAISTYSDVQRGNHNRAGNAEVGSAGAITYDEKKEHRKQEKDHAQRALRSELYDRHTGDMIPIRPGLPRDPKALRLYLKEQHELAEERRLAAMCGCEADEISIEKTTLIDKPNHKANHHE